MFYAGSDLWGEWKIGVATSVDGIAWERRARGRRTRRFGAGLLGPVVVVLFLVVDALVDRLFIVDIV